jgi:hypothetical protein
MAILGRAPHNSARDQATGVDVNVRFTGIDAFEFTDEVAIFDLLGMQLLHGWLVDPQVGFGRPHR